MRRRTDQEKERLRLEEAGDFILMESGVDGGPFNADGTMNVCIIRPGQSRGVKGPKVYTREMLEAEAPSFKSWPMFENHESPAARRARGPIPRPTSDLRGEIRESWWNPDFTTPEDEKLGFEPGAVLGRAMPTPSLRELVETIPNALKMSVRAFATDFLKGTYKGRAAELVEGFDHDLGGSIDVVTKAGAGGHVLALMESGYDQEHGEAERTLEDVADDDLVHHIGLHRPHLRPLIEAAVEEGNDSDPSPDDNPDPQAGVEESGVPLTESEKKELTEAAATAASDGARSALKDFVGGDDFKTAVADVVKPLMEAEVAAVADEQRELLEAGMVPRRQVEVRDLREFAHGRIKAAKGLPDAFKEDLLLRYSVEEAADGTLVPRPSLDITAVVKDGEVEKSARKVLEEALDEDIERERVKLAAARPTRVSGQGAATRGDGESSRSEREVEEAGTDGSKERSTRSRPLSGWRAGLVAAHGGDPKVLDRMAAAGGRERS